MTKVERVARALERTYHKESGGKWVCGSKKECWKGMVSFARAAIRSIGRSEDSERLDWLNRRGNVLFASAAKPPCFHAWKNDKGGYGVNVRAAIDIARCSERRQGRKR